MVAENSHSHSFGQSVSAMLEVSTSAPHKAV